MKYTSLFILMLLAVGIFIFNQKAPTSDAPSAPPLTPPKAVNHPTWIDTPWQERLPTPPARTVPVSSTDPRFNYRPDGFNEYHDGFTVAEKIAATDHEPSRINHLETLFSQYRWAFKNMPIGSENAELTQQLLGDNPKFLIFIPHDISYLNPRGELLDSFGTPYFFHPESDRKIGIRSAGPDLKLWTKDDLISDL